MLPIEEIRIKLSDRNLAEVARRLGVTRAWLSAIVNGNGLPSYAMLQRLNDYLEKH